ncbi:MAG: tRNA uridine(34) 5-carboxymethylaminomethyl modification radical SAM/GNAT enzyme Elp3 [Patescibacteria group bacterium]
MSTKKSIKLISSKKNSSILFSKVNKKQQQAIAEILASKIVSREDLADAKRLVAKKYGIDILYNSEILKEYRRLRKQNKIPELLILEKVLRKRVVRTMSGIAPVAVLTEPFPCPGKCTYCPTEKDVPQSYLSNEPAVMRAIRCNYNPYQQVQLRLRALEANGHKPTKIELIVIGGTWSVLPENYKYWYILQCFRAANKYWKKNSIFSSILRDQFLNNFQLPNFQFKKLKQQLLVEQKKNESAKYKIIGITLETRPDYINEKELLEMRELGVTRVEMGVQAIDDKILELNKRGHGVKEIVDATRLLKNFGFKVTYHIMPGLPGSTAKKDLDMFKSLFSDERFQPDQIEFYPTVVTQGSLLYKWWQEGKYKSYSDKVLQNLIVKCKEAVPQYVRIIRLIRDIPGESIFAGNKITNLRQIMKDRGVKCQCIRCREAKERQLTITNYELSIIKYKASGGEEYFIQAVDKNDNSLYGFCRLRLSLQNTKYKYNSKEGINTALIRELHVYGELVSIGQEKKIQHSGFGKMLMTEAEKIAKENNFKKISVISGIGVRGYYRKLGYRLKDSYMVKSLI